MNGAKREDGSSLLEKLIAIFLRLPWLEVAEKAWKIIRKAIQFQPHAGMYEVLNYESTLELKDRSRDASHLQKTRISALPAR
jgi:hypothetical protein